MTEFYAGQRVVDIQGREGIRPSGTAGTIINISRCGEYLRVCFDNPGLNNENYISNGSHISCFEPYHYDPTLEDTTSYYQAITGDGNE
jgi:hypothetical protein